MPLNDPEYLPPSYLSQTGYCPRRVGLLLNEQIWLESADTAKGRQEHDRVHTQRIERRGSDIKLFEYAVFSDTLGISGKCDFVPLPELMDRKKRDIMERKGDKENENKRQKQQKESSAAAL